MRAMIMSREEFCARYEKDDPRRVEMVITYTDENGVEHTEAIENTPASDALAEAMRGAPSSNAKEYTAIVLPGRPSSCEEG